MTDAEPDKEKTERSITQPPYADMNRCYPAQKSRPIFPVVGVGASAGGLSAFERFFKNLPEKTGMAFVVVQHLSQPHKTILPEILKNYTNMPVQQVTNGIEIKPDCVYVIPPSNHLAMLDGHLILLKSPTNRGPSFSIDFFFRSLAENRKNLAVGIVLSGIANDGSLGVKTIKAEGGITIAQDPETAEFADMPRNAITSHNIDFILPPEKMGEFIQKLLNHQIEEVNLAAYTPPTHSTEALQKLYNLLRQRTGHDFSLYKQNTLLRRIDRRIKISLVHDLDAYIQLLQNRPEELDALFHDMLINVTQFFRDPDAFEALTEKAIRPLIPQKAATQSPLRVWVTGCSTGEEAYSVAIILQEQIEALQTECKIQVYATDLDNEAIIAARHGIFTDGSLENVSPDRMKRFFTKEDNGYQIKKSIRDMVVFSTQNLVFDPPFSKIDLLCCRNLLIYLETELQNQLFPMFHYSLNSSGYLFLGNSESISNFSDLFSVVDRKHKLYRRKDVISQHRIHTRIESALDPSNPVSSDISIRQTSLGGLREWTEKELLKFHTPACVIIDEKNNILYIHGRTGKFLEPSPGETSVSLLRMAREGLKSELATAIHESTTTKKTVNRLGIRVKTNGDYQVVNLTVRPVEWESNKLNLSMVVFEEAPAAPIEPSAQPQDRFSKDSQVAELEKELKEKDDYLTSIINELEDTNQELKSMNEELLSSNEEMQSSNEELETSREELQSINEELNTVNAELQNKNSELTMLNNDVYNLLASTEIGTMFLDLDLHLRRFTPAIQQIYNFISGDIGRPIQHFHSNLKYDRLLDDIKEVLSNLVPKAIEAQSRLGVWYLVNIQPYRTLDNVIDGVVITFVDITKQKQRDERLRLDTLIRDSNDAITVQDFDGNIQSWNQAAVLMYGWSEAEALSMNIRDLLPENLRKSTLDLYHRIENGEVVRSFETKRVTRHGLSLNVWVTISPLYDYTNRPIGISTTERDISERNKTAQKLRFENRTLKVIKAWYEQASSNSPAQGIPSICKILVQTGGYCMAWRCGLQPEDEKTLRVVDWAGFGESTAQPPKPLKSLLTKSQSLAMTALETRRPIAVRNILDPVQKTWHATALKLAFQSFLLLPLYTNDKSLGVLAIYSEEPEAFIDQEFENLKLLSDRISSRLASQPEE